MSTKTAGLDIACDGDYLYVAYADPGNEDKLKVLRYNGSWETVGTAGASEGSIDCPAIDVVMMLSMWLTRMVLTRIN